MPKKSLFFLIFSLIFSKKNLDFIFSIPDLEISIPDLEISIPDLENSKRAFRKKTPNFRKIYPYFRQFFARNFTKKSVLKFWQNKDFSLQILSYEIKSLFNVFLCFKKFVIPL